ncbi:MAG: DUF4340 domain-containing protein [Phycisphaerales bacterium]|nr:DUF4340 domain-containing protein [Phycisphaerales bacterium]
MKSTTLVILSIVTAGAVGLAVLSGRGGSRVPAGAVSAAPGSAFLPDLAAKLNSAGSLTVQKGKVETTIARKGDGWVLPAKGDYPAEFEKVKEALVALADLKVVEAKTSNKEFYDKLGVGDPASESGTSRLVTVKDASGAELVSLIIGNITSAQAGRPMYFVRRPADAQSWQVQGLLNIEADPLNWVARQILSVDKERMKSITVVHAAAGDKPDETVRVFRDSQTDPQFLVRDKPAGRDLKHEAVTDQLTNGLSYLTFDDVKPVSQVNFDAAPTPPAPAEKKEGEPEAAPPPASSGPVTAEFRTFDGLVLTARMINLEGKWWTAFQASFEPPAAAATDEKKEAAAPPAVPKPRTPEEVKKEVDELNAKLAPWAFALPEYRGKQIASRMEDLLKPPAPPQPPPGPAGPLAPGSEGPAGEEPSGPVPLPPK